MAAWKHEVIANSSSAKGITVSLDEKRSETFTNEGFKWFYATEIVIDDSYSPGIEKLPGFGDLCIYSRSGTDESKLIAKFPKGSWEYVRLVT